MAIQCLETAFDITDSSYLFQPSKPLLDIFVAAEGRSAVCFIFKFDKKIQSSGFLQFSIFVFNCVPVFVATRLKIFLISNLRFLEAAIKFQTKKCDIKFQEGGDFPKPTANEIIIANNLKEEGNALMKSSQFEDAVLKYNEAIKLNKDPAYFCNR